MKKIKRTISVILVVLMCVPLFTFTSSARIAIDLNEAEIIINAQPLYPQKTGYPELDLLIENILLPYSYSSTYAKIQGVYDWCVNNVEYSWDGYTQQTAPAYDKFGIDYNLEQDSTIISPYPKDMINRAYHSITAGTGVCYDYAILFTVMARYIGIESYVHTGILTIGDWTGHHGWSELILNGYAFIFDPQQDYREVYTRGGDDCHAHFGIPTPNARWANEYNVNSERDSQLLPMTSNQIKRANVTVISSRSGEVKSVTQKIGTTVTLKSNVSGKKVEKWICCGNIVSNSDTYSFTVKEDTVIYALFDGDVFVDVKNDWYTDSVMSAYDMGIMLGTSSYEFSPDVYLTRAMIVKMLATLAEVDLSVYNNGPFKDVIPGQWYANAANWAYKNGITAGVTKDTFEPNAKLTREQAVSMMIRYLEYCNCTKVSNKINISSYTDSGSISPYAVDNVKKGIYSGILSGYADKSLKPGNYITRAEAAVMLGKLIDNIHYNHIDSAA